jgi:hypothetical protein
MMKKLRFFILEFGIAKLFSIAKLHKFKSGCKV